MTDVGARTSDVGIVNDGTAETPGGVVTSVPNGTDRVPGTTSFVDKGRIGVETDTDERAEPKVDVTPRSIVLSDFNNMLKEIELSEMLQQELRETDPNLASALSFLNVVTGEKGRKKSVKPGEVTIGAAEPVRRNAKTAEVVRLNSEMAELVRQCVEKTGGGNVYWRDGDDGRNDRWECKRATTTSGRRLGDAACYEDYCSRILIEG